MKKEKLFSVAIIALMMTAACTGKFETVKNPKSGTTVKTQSDENKTHQELVLEQASVDTQLKDYGVDLVNVEKSQEALDNYLYNSKKLELEKITTLLQRFIELGTQMIAKGDNGFSAVEKTENALELQKISVSFASSL